ncbi:MAG: tetratricopeptide repeat protein [Promethearchaeia archaeon]
MEKKDYSERISKLNAILEENPQYFTTLYELGRAFRKSGNLDQAFSTFQECLEVSEEHKSSILININLLGLRQLREEKYKKAKKIFNYLVDFQPENSAHHKNLGLSYDRLGKSEDAIKAYRRALEKDPKNYIVSINLANIYYKNGKLDRAFDQYASLLKQKANDNVILNNLIILGHKFVEKRREKKVNKICKMVGNSNSKNPMLWIDLGKLYQKLEKYKVAINSYERALTFNPNHKLSLNSLGHTYFLQQEYDKAIRYFLKSLYIDSNSRLPINNLLKIASEYYKSKQYKRAIRLLKLILNIDESVTEAWVDLGLAYRRLSQLENSVHAYKRALKLDKENELVWNNLGFTYYKMKDYPNAVDAYHHALKLNSKFEYPLNNLLEISRYYYKKENFKETITLLKEIVQFQPDNASNWIRLGLSYSKIGKFEKALKAYKHASVEEKKSERIYNNLGFVHYQLKNYKKAADSYLKALEVNPDYAITIENLSNLALELTDRGKYDQATKIYSGLAERENIQIGDLINLGRVYRIKKKYKKSIQIYKKALNLDEKNELIWNNLGYAFECKGEIEKAVEAYSNSLKVDSQYPLSYNNLCSLSFHCIDQNEYQIALRVFKTLLANQKERFEFWNELFSMYRKTEQYKELLKQYNQYKNLISLNNSIGNDVGYSYFSIGKFLRCIDSYYQALRSDPHSENTSEDLLEITHQYISEQKIQKALEICDLLLSFQQDNEDAEKLMKKIKKENKSIT